MLSPKARLLLLVPLFAATSPNAANLDRDPAPLTPADPKVLVRRAIEAMGGENPLRGIRNRRVVTTSMVFALGQLAEPGGTPPAIGTVTSETIDHRRGIHWIQNTIGSFDGRRTPTFMFSMNHAALRLNDTTVVAVQPSLASMFDNAELRAARSPDRLLLRLLDEPPTNLEAMPDTQPLGRSLPRLRARLDGQSLVLTFDPFTGLPVSIESTADDPVFGQHAQVREYGQWTPNGGYVMPREERDLVGGRLRQLRVAAITQVNVASIDTLAGPPGTFARPRRRADSAVVVELAPGVVRVEGGDGARAHGAGVPYYSIAIEDDGSTVVFELPLDDERTRVVLAALARRFPFSPVRQFVVTHWHLDHTGGARAGFAQGLAAVAPRELTPLLSRIGLADRERAPTRRRIVAVDDSLVIGRGTNRLVLYRVPTTHASAMILGYLPGPGIILESDLAGLAAPAQPRELRDFILARGLSVKGIVGAHGKVVTWDEFVSTVK